ncbi:hypothetical protein N9276_01210 [Rhodopirellula sp.]|nr:hypothetical protein [Rhodopirellula sp.]
MLNKSLMLVREIINSAILAAMSKDTQQDSRSVQKMRQESD